LFESKQRITANLSFDQGSRYFVVPELNQNKILILDLFSQKSKTKTTFIINLFLRTLNLLFVSFFPFCKKW